MKSILTNRRAGYATTVGPAGLSEESDTATCCHCNRVWVVKSTAAEKGDPGGFCRLCARMICPTCVGNPCVPFERRLQQMESSDRMMRQMGL